MLTKDKQGIVTVIYKLFFFLPLGEFGIVYKAHLLPQIELDSKLSCCPLPQTVAVKTLKGRYHQ